MLSCHHRVAGENAWDLQILARQSYLHLACHHRLAGRKLLGSQKPFQDRFILKLTGHHRLAGENAWGPKNPYRTSFGLKPACDHRLVCENTWEPKILLHLSFWNSPVITDSRAKTLGDLQILSRHIYLNRACHHWFAGENALGPKKNPFKTFILKLACHHRLAGENSWGPKILSRHIYFEARLPLPTRGRKRLGTQKSF